MMVEGDIETFNRVTVPMPVLSVKARSRRPVGRLSYEDVVAAIEECPRARGSRIAKWTIDIVGSALGLVVLAPLLVLLALAVKLSSPGPVLFVQDRCGLGGRRFRFLKFRT